MIGRIDKAKSVEVWIKRKDSIMLRGFTEIRGFERQLESGGMMKVYIGKYPTVDVRKAERMFRREKGLQHKVFKRNILESGEDFPKFLKTKEDDKNLWSLW